MSLKVKFGNFALEDVENFYAILFKKKKKENNFTIKVVRKVDIEKKPPSLTSRKLEKNAPRVRTRK